MKNNLKIKFICTILFSTIFFPFVEARAGVNVNEVDNSILCKGKTSCNWLKQACAEEDGNYTPADEYGKCVFPSVTQIDDSTVAPSNPIVPRRGQVVPKRGEVVPNRGEVVPNRGEVVPNRGEVVPNRGEVVPNRGEVVPNRGEVVPNRRGE